MSTQDKLEILRCVVDWVYKDKDTMERVHKAKVVAETLKRKKEAPSEAHQKLRQKSDDNDSIFNEPEFLDELKKL